MTCFATSQALGISLAQDDAPSTSHYTFSSDGRIINFYGEAFGSKTKDRREFDNSGRFMHVPRQVLRARLLERIRPGTIRWNSKVKGFSCWSDAEGGGEWAWSRRSHRKGSVCRTRLYLTPST
jgi:2-polyprenyl-6-methoxyphenol hydroxylase-like FAD-dependent oxidoreductase